MLNVSLLGNLGSDPELKYGQNGSGRLQMNVAVNQRTRVEGEWTEKTEWIRCTVFGARAETLASYLKKGTRVYVSGRLEARPWTDQQGNVRAGLEVIADTVEFMSAKNDAVAPLVRAGKPTSAAMEDLDDTSDLPF